MNYNIILNVGGTEIQSNLLKNRIKSKNKNTEVAIFNLKKLNHLPTEEEINAFKKLNSNSRIFIIDHCMPNSRFLGNIHYTELAEFFGKRIKNKEEILGDENNLKINIIGCHAAIGDNDNAESLAALFHRTLKNSWGLKTKVTARKEVVMINDFILKKGKTTTSLLNYGIFNFLCSTENFKTFKENVNENKKPGTKITLEWDEEGNQVVVDSYLEKLANEANFICREYVQKKINHPKNDFIEKHLKKIQEMIKIKESLNYELAIQIQKELIQLDLLSSNDNEFLMDFNVGVKKLIDFIEKSISKKSDRYHIIMKKNEMKTEESESINTKWTRTVLKPISSELEKLPNTYLKDPLLNFFQKKDTLLVSLFNGFSYKSKLGKKIDLESDIILFLHSSLEIINSDLSNKEKSNLIENKFNEIYKKIYPKTELTTRMKGFVGGVKRAISHGKHEFLSGALNLKGAIEQEKQMAECEDTIYPKITKEFYNICMDYLDKEDKISPSKFTNEELIEKTILTNTIKYNGITEHIIQKYRVAVEKNLSDYNYTTNEIEWMIHKNETEINSASEKLEHFKKNLPHLTPNEEDSKKREMSILYMQKSIHKLSKNNKILKNVRLEILSSHKSIEKKAYNTKQLMFITRKENQISDIEERFLSNDFNNISDLYKELSVLCNKSEEYFNKKLPYSLFIKIFELQEKMKQSAASCLEEIYFKSEQLKKTNEHLEQKLIKIQSSEKDGNKRLLQTNIDVNCINLSNLDKQKNDILEAQKQFSLRKAPFFL